MLPDRADRSTQGHEVVRNKGQTQPGSPPIVLTIETLSGQSGCGLNCRSACIGGSVGLPPGWWFESSDSFFLVADAIGEGFDGGAEVADLGGEAGEGSGVVVLVAVVLDDGS